MKTCRGSMTVEAAILLPFVIIVSVMIMYFSVFVYDRTLMVSDVNTLTNVITDAPLYSKSARSVCEEEFSTIRDEHPYLSMENINLLLSREDNSVVVGLSGDWIMPLYPGYSRQMQYKKEVRTSSPIPVMYLVKQVDEGKKESENADSDDI